jgi:YD repeat-containing protein
MVADPILAALLAMASLFTPAGDPVDPGTGLFEYEKTDLSLNDVVPIGVTRTYRQSDNRARAFGIGTTHNYDMFLVGDASFYTYQELVLPNGARVRFDRISPGAFFGPAVYQNLSSLGAFYGAKIHFNGAGWSLTRKDGAIFKFADIVTGTTRLLSIEDGNGNIVTVDRNPNDTVSRVTSPNGRYIDFTYDASNRIERLQDNSGRHVDYVYDAGRLTQVTDANNGVWTYDYDAAHQMTGIHDARNILYLQNHYDANGRVDLQTQADTGTFQFDYTTDTNGRVTQTDVTDPRGNVRRLTFGAGVPSPNGFIAGGYVGTDTFSYGTSLEMTITTERQPGTNLPTSVTDSLGRVTTTTYDTLGNVTSITRLAGTANAVTTRFTYDSTFANVTSITDPIGRTTRFDYDSHGNLTLAVDPLGNRASWTYNTAGQVLASTDPNGNVTTFGYTAGNLTSVTDPVGRTVSFTYDNLGRQLTTSTIMGATVLEYHPLNLVTRITDAFSGITDLTYDPQSSYSQGCSK